MVLQTLTENLCPVAVTLDRYIKDALKHLLDSSTYELLSEDEAFERDAALRKDIFKWTVKWRPQIGDDVVEFLRRTLNTTREDPFGYFYLLYKLHKTPIKTRPVCSDCASTTHGLGQWVNEILQPVALAQQAYFKDSFALKDRLDQVELEPDKRYSIFSFDTVSMYTNIDTEDCIKRLSDFFTFGKEPETFWLPSQGSS